MTRPTVSDERSDITAAKPTLTELDRDLDELRERASDDAQEANALAPNSYGAGYNDGYRDALAFVLESIRGERL